MRMLHRLAEEDLAGAIRFYKREAGPGVARRFLNEFERVATLLERLPDIGTPLAGDRRTFPLLDFPFSVIYRRDESGLRVLVVRHQSRDPAFGDGRQ